jgi:signal transduction histidine kinase
MTAQSSDVPSRAVTAAAVVAAWAALGLLSTLDSYLLNLFEGSPDAIGSVLARQMPRWLLWALLTPPVLWLGRHVPFERRPRWVPILFHAAAGTTIAILHLALTFVFLLPWLPQFAPGQEPARMFGLFITSQLHFGLLGYGTILGAGFAVEYHRRLVARGVREARLEAQLVQARLQALQTRLHPHFLFNTLHAASVLIDERPKDARRVLSRLGDLLRDLLERTDVREILLADELDLLRPYIEIQEIRFHDRLTVELDVAVEVMPARVPSFLLQPLVENAVDHGIGARAGAGRVEISARRRDGSRPGESLEIRIANTHPDRPPPAPDSWKPGIGLSATRERLEKLYGDRAGLEIAVAGGLTTVSVRLPWIASSEREGVVV